MGSREKILSAVAKNQPTLSHLPRYQLLKGGNTGLAEKFVSMLSFIGGKVIEINSLDEITAYINSTVSPGQRVVNTLTEITGNDGLTDSPGSFPHLLQDIELAIISAPMGVAENGAVWVNADLLTHRVLPFICQHLAVVLKKDTIVATMHEAYENIADKNYGFSTFIAGPSKTADIEQSLVLGAHGPRTMTVFLMGS